MKKYYKEIDGNREWLGAVLINDDMQIYNPTEEQILAAGYVEDTTELVEIPNEGNLENLKRGKVLQIEAYDKSEAVNQFFIKGIPLWLDREERATLQRRFEIEQKAGKTDSVLWKNGVSFPLVIAEAMQMLDVLEMYAIASYDNTQKHIAAVNAISTLEELEAYDYMAGYPEKLRF